MENKEKESVIINMNRIGDKIGFTGTYNGINFSGEFEMEGDTLTGKFNKIESEFQAEGEAPFDAKELLVIREKLIEGLREMGFDITGENAKFSTGGGLMVVTFPMKIMKQGGIIDSIWAFLNKKVTLECFTK